MTHTEQTDIAFMLLFERREQITFKSLEPLLNNSYSDSVRSLETIADIEYASKTNNRSLSMGILSDAFNYSINNKGIDFINSLPSEYVGKPYSYYLVQQYANKSKKNLTEWYLTENAKNQFEDYPRLKKQAKWTLIIAVISAIIALVAILK